MGADKFFGLYRGICMDVSDPELKSRIKLQVPQVLGPQVTDWAWPCRAPATDHEHEDHKPHKPSEIIAVLDVNVQESSAGYVPHTHSVQVTLAPQGDDLEHEHKPVVPPRGQPEPADWQETEKQHTPHVRVPKVGDGVWVMFEAGDPDLPVWLGVF